MKLKHPTAVRLSLLSLVIAIFGICLYSCQNSTDEPQTAIDPQEAQAFQQLQTDLDAFTAEFVASHSDDPESRGFWGWITKIIFKVVINVISVDSCHFFDNFFSGRNVFEGVGAASSQAFSMQENMPDINYISLNPLQRKRFDDLYSHYDSLANTPTYKENINYGYLHNYAILHQIKSSQFDNSSVLAMTTIQTQAIQKLNNPDIKLSTPEKQAEYVVSYMEKIHSDNPAELRINLLKHHPSREAELNILMQFIKEIDNIPSAEAFKAYAVGYIQTILNSDITNQNKRNLVALINMATESTLLWSTLLAIKDQDITPLPTD